MASYTVNCPACGKCFEYSELLETVFCSNCGKKLRLQWRIDSVTLDDGSAPAFTPRGNPQAPEPSSRVESDARLPVGYLQVTINMPRDCLPLKGNFSYYGVKWDGKDMGICQKGETITLRTLARDHQLTVRQINSRMVGNEIKEETFKVPINGSRTINVKVGPNGFEVE
ncbi:MAG: hypothetical protein J5707_05490 [Candidatus Methanomethylophilus sp.]|nr:hypothetical protein [Methanomethylophilus sp.]